MDNNPLSRAQQADRNYFQSGGMLKVLDGDALAFHWSRSKVNPKCEILKCAAIIEDVESRRNVLGSETDSCRLLALFSDTLDMAPPASPSTDDTDWEHLVPAGFHAANNICPIVSELCLSMLASQGMIATLSWYAQRRFQGLDVEFHIRDFGAPTQISPQVIIALFLVAQEAINNIARHSAARHAVCVLEFGDRETRMRIADDGRGFDTMRFASRSDVSCSRGLINMQELTDTVGGAFRLRSVPGDGTVIRISVPCKPERSTSGR